jgi:hypothetical protein
LVGGASAVATRGVAGAGALAHEVRTARATNVRSLGRTEGDASIIRGGVYFASPQPLVYAAAMTPRNSVLIPLALAAGLVLGCGNKAGDDKPAASGSAAASAAAAGAVDPKILAMATAASACKSWESGGFDSSCADYKKYSDAKDDFNDGKADASLVAMLADPNEKIRYLGAYKLNQYGKTFKTDKTMAAAVVTAAEKEKTKFAAYEIGSAVGRILVRDTGTFDRVKAIVKKHDVPDMRRGILSNLLFNNSDYDPVYALDKDMVKDADKSVAMAALTAFWTGGSRKADETCHLYADNIENPNDDMAAEASNALGWWGRCSSKFDMLLDSLEKRVKANNVSSASYASAARHLCEDAKSNDKQKKRGADLGRKIADRKDNKAWVRSSALETVMKCDTSNSGRSFVGKFKKDPEKSVADRANELLAKK